MEDSGGQLPDVREQQEEEKVPTEWRRENRRRKREGGGTEEGNHSYPLHKLKRRRLEEDAGQDDWGHQPPTEEDRRKDVFVQSTGPTLMRSRKWRQAKLMTWSATETWMRRNVIEDVLDRVSWLALLGEEEEELRMSSSDWDSQQKTTMLGGVTCVQNILKRVVERAFRIVEYRKEKRRKQEEVRQFVEKIVESIVKRGGNILEYRRKVEQKKKKESAEYPSVRNWLTPKHPVGNQTAGLRLQDGAKCGNGVSNKMKESNQTAGGELELGLECRRKCPPGQGNYSFLKFNHNSTTTKPRSKGKKKLPGPIITYSSRGSKRKARDLDLTAHCQSDNWKRRRYGPMDDYLVIKNSAKLGGNDPEVTVKAPIAVIPKKVLNAD